jgi:hypothetical protein
MLEKLLTDAGPSVLCLFQLHRPVINRGIQNRKYLLLFQQQLMAELGDTRRAQVLADA